MCVRARTFLLGVTAWVWALGFLLAQLLCVLGDGVGGQVAGTQPAALGYQGKPRGVWCAHKAVCTGKLQF